MYRVGFVLPVIKKLPWDREKLLGLSSIALLIGALLAGCRIQSSPRLERLLSLQIRTADLPSGWFVDGVGIGDRDKENEGILSRWIQFRGVPEAVFPTVLAIHELTDYPDLDQATSVYAEIVKKEFPVQDWAWPEQVHFASQADQFRLACLERHVDIHDNVDERFRGSYHCKAVAQYGTIISVIYANVFKDQWLTFEDLQHLLEAADARLAAGQP
jgi:hypothetical protein